MNLLFEEDGEIKVGSVLEAIGGNEPTSYQVQLTTGRRAKVKAAQVLLKFAQPEAAQVMPAAQALSETLEVAFLWEVAPHDEFEIAALGADYFGQPPTPVQWLALLLALQAAPIYFRRKGKGRYKPAPEAELKAALAGLEKKRQQAQLQAQWVEQLKGGSLPADWRDKVAYLAFKPDKNSTEYKALDQAAHELHLSSLSLLQHVGAFASVKDIHRTRFLVEWFPRGTGFEPIAAPELPEDLPTATVRAFSIDDSMTTEIDDAFSVQWLSDQRVKVGVHIAAPGSGFAPGSALDALARKRLSTVYMPGEKITMLPEAVVEAFTLAQGRICPALSLYAEFDLSTGQCLSRQTVLEQVFIESNLRHDELDEIITEATLADTSTEFPFKRELQVLWQLTQILSQQREQLRGKPEPRNRADFTFRVEQINGAEKVEIEQRQRDAPLDRLVAEWMIFANSSWGQRLEQAGVPGIYRTQTHWARPGSRQSAVKMSTVPAPHIGIGVSHYAWSSSPLRRYVDLVNQWQMIAVVRGYKPPFEKNSSDLFAIIGAFDAAYAAYAEVQNQMERYWSLRWLQQQAWVGSGVQVDAVILRNEQARLLSVPLAAPLSGAGHLAPGTHVQVEVLAVDELALSLELRLSAIVAAEPETEALLDELEDDTLELPAAQIETVTSVNASMESPSSGA
jgi:exoribonuclease-2